MTAKAWKAVILLIVSLLLGCVSARDANIAYHIIWDERMSNGAQAVSLSTYLRTIYDAANLYLIDVVSPATALDVLSSSTGIGSYSNVRLRSVRRPVPHGISEALQLLDGMGELLWWSEEEEHPNAAATGIDFYIPLFTSELIPVLKPAEMRAALSQLRGYSFFNRVPGDNVYDRTYFDARLVFSRNASALARLLGPHSLDPEGRHRGGSKTALMNTHHRNLFVCSGEFLRIATDSRLSTRLLASMANGYDARDYFFATLARSSNTAMITTASLRCDDGMIGMEGDAASCLFRKRDDGHTMFHGNGNDNDYSHETIVASMKAHIPRSMVQLDPASPRVLPL